jgi:hypothetical protein
MKLAYLLMIVPCLSHAVDWKEHPYDKISHVVIGGALSCAVTAKTDNPWLGALSSILVGAIKEGVIDDNFNRADLASWGVGGAVGTLCIRF